MCEKEVLIHKWEDLGVGKAPFRYVAMIALPSRGIQEANPDAYNMAMRDAHQQARAFGLHGLGSCDVCGMGLVYNFVIQDANGKYFIVGSDCVGKTYDSKLIGSVENAERLRKKAIADAKREAEWAARAEKNRLLLEAERAANGGLTNAEVRAKQEAEAAEARRVAFSAENAWLINAIRGMPGDFVESMVRNLESGSIKLLSDRMIAILRDIYAKRYGRSGSKKWSAGCDEFDLKAGFDPEE